MNEALSFRAYNVPQYGPDGFVNNASHATKWKDHKAIQDAIDISWDALQKELLQNPARTSFPYKPKASRIGSVWGVGYEKADLSRTLKDYNGGFTVIFEKYGPDWKIKTMYPE
jgi:hypothetical protein